MSTLWSVEQQAWLKALGHRVMVLAGDEALDSQFGIGEGAADTHGVSARDTTPLRVPGAVATKSSPERRVSASELAAGKAQPPRMSAAVERPVETRRPPAPTVPGDALERALLSATGQRTRSEARAVLQRLGVDAAALRGDAAGKRALWQQLRPLRPRFRA